MRSKLQQNAQNQTSEGYLTLFLFPEKTTFFMQMRVFSIVLRALISDLRHKDASAIVQGLAYLLHTLPKRAFQCPNVCTMGFYVLIPESEAFMPALLGLEVEDGHEGARDHQGSGSRGSG